MLVRAMIARGSCWRQRSRPCTAQAPVERGKYLVNTIMTCQNCHTPKGERGAPIFERDLSSGLSWDEPPFKVTASNITQDKETGIGAWSDADIKKALQKGERPNGVQLAAIMPSDFYEILTPRRSQRDRRLSAHREAGEAEVRRRRSTRSRCRATFRRAPRSRSAKPTWPTR